MTVPPARSTRQTGLAALACTGCRKQHLKCDAKRPVCSRCIQNGETCYYEPSRRGGRRKPRPQSIASEGHGTLMSGDRQMRDGSSINNASIARTSTSREASTCVSLSGDDSPTTTAVTDSAATDRGQLQAPASERRNIGAHPVAPNSRHGPPPVNPDGDLLSYLSDMTSDHLSWFMPTPRDTSNGTRSQTSISHRPSSESDRYRRLYYENFHTAHPILVPASMYASRAYPHYLHLAVDFAGSHYSQTTPSENLRSEVDAALAANTELSTCAVQALLIYSIVLFSRDEIADAHIAFGRCAEIALEIGMNRADFASSRHPENSVEAESLRRTWWELFVADVLMAIPLKTISFRCSAVSPEVPLPCEESLYTGNCELPEPRKVLEFKRRILLEEDVVFSSFSYRIEAATILGRVLVLNRLKDYHRDHLQAIENALVSWSNHLPMEKMEIVDPYGNMDEMMFQAHVIIAHASMLLHLPRSRFYPLLSSPQDDFMPYTHLHSSSASTRLVQSIKAMNASRRLSDYISLCPNIQKHTPFIIPALAMAGLTQLATSKNHSEECFDHHYNRVTLVLGCLKKMKRTWHLAEPAYHRVRSCAARLISDLMDKLNSEPLSKSAVLTQSTPRESEENNSPTAEAIPAVSQVQLVPELDPSFIDPICYSYSLFSSLPEFQDG